MDTLDLLIYLDEFLTKNLNSLVIDGLIESRKSRWIEDRGITGRTASQNREQDFDEDRYIKDERDGYKGKNTVTANTWTGGYQEDRSLEGRRVIRREEELTRIYTSFEFHNQLVSGLNQSNLIKNINSNNIKEGDYVQAVGEISPMSMLSFLDMSSNVISGLGSSNLNQLMASGGTSSIVSGGNSLISNSANSLLGAGGSSLLNFDYMLNQYSYMKNLISANNTQDIVLKCSGRDIVVSANNSYFLNSSQNMYDKSNCNCKVIGKVIKACNENENINFLRHTGNAEVCRKTIENCSGLTKLLNDNGIVLPQMPKCESENNALLMIPISLYL